jgi:enoyl-CoA hydratase
VSIRYEETSGIATITLSRPPVNALDYDAVIALENAFKQLRSNPSAAGAILTGDGAAFSAGVDVRAFMAYEPAKRREMALAITRMTSAALALACPLVAAINGHALGGGFVLALCCDYRIAIDDPNLKLGLPEARAGVPFPAGPLRIIRHELPPGLLRQLALSSQTETPHRLADIGVLDALTTRDALMSTARERTAALAAQPGFEVVKQQTRGDLAAELSALVEAGCDPFIGSFG